MIKNILKIVLIFVLGVGGGIFASQIPWFYKYQSANVSLPLTEKKEIIIQENTALQDAAEKVEKSVVGISSKLKTGEIVTGSGLIVTSDGLIVTLAELVPNSADIAFFINNGKTPKYQVLKRDQKTNLVLLKIEETDLQTCKFADFNEIKLGQSVFLVGVIFLQSEPLKMVNQGVVKYFTNDYIRTNIFETNSLTGSALFNIKGELLGLNTIDSQGKVTAIPITKLRAFLGF